MLCGIPPFYNENLERMYELIKLAELRFPKKINISKDAQDIIVKVKLLFTFSYSTEILTPDLEL